MPPKILLSVCCGAGGGAGGAGGAGWFSVSGGVEDVFDVMYGLEVDSSLSGEVAGRVSSPTNSMDGILWVRAEARPVLAKTEWEGEWEGKGRGLSSLFDLRPSEKSKENNFRLTTTETRT
jgi:hypothetical protein